MLGLRVLVVEREFLIALDLQRIAELAGASACVLANSIDGAIALGPELAECQLALVEVPELDAPARDLLATLAANGVSVVIVTASNAVASDLRDRVVILKPFAEQDVLDAARAAIGTGASAPRT